MLGHADLATTHIYTNVTGEKMKAVHVSTHPAKLQRDSDKEALLSMLESEQDENDQNDDELPDTSRRRTTRHGACNVFG